MVPAHFLENINSHVNGSAAREILGGMGGHHGIVRDGNYIPNSDYRRVSVNQDLQEWIDENILKDSYGASEVCYAYQNFRNLPFTRNRHHIDKTRYFTLMYLEDLGGDNVLTQFWQEPNKLTVRTEYVITPQEFEKKIPTFSLIDSITIEPHRWGVVNSKIIHSVENLTRCRSGIQINLDLNNSITKDF